MLPRTATPSAPPTWRVVSFTAEPTPAFASGSEPMIDSVAGAIVRPMPSAQDQQRDHDVPVARRRRVSVRQHHRPDGDDRQARRRPGPWCRSARRAGRDRRDDHQRRARRRDADPGLERRVAEHELQVLRQEEHRAEQGEEHERDRRARGGEARVLEERDVEHRVVGVELPATNAHQHDDRRSRATPGSASRPAVRRRLDDRRRAGDEADDRQHRADRVERARRRVLRVRHDQPTRDERDDHDGHVHEEDRAPPEVLEQEAAGERAERDARGRTRRPRCRWPGRAPRRGNTLVRIDSVAGMMNAPPMPMSARVTISVVADPANADSERADAEDDQADGERAAAAEAVAEAAGGEQQAGEHERVGVDDPLQLAGRWRPRSRTSVGRATLRIVLSSPITSRLRQSTPRIHHRRSYPSACSMGKTPFRYVVVSKQRTRPSVIPQLHRIEIRPQARWRLTVVLGGPVHGDRFRVPRGRTEP